MLIWERFNVLHIFLARYGDSAMALQFIQDHFPDPVLILIISLRAWIEFKIRKIA
jgi:hypothetical protein